MPNWTYTTYVFRSKEKEPVQDFRNKLLIWTQEKSLCENAWDGSSYWLGNILLHAGFEYDDKYGGFHECHCRGSIEEIRELEEESLHNENFFYFIVTTETAWVEMPKMWNLIIDKLYSGKIEFGFIAEEETCDYVDRYRPDILELNVIKTEDKYWLDHYVKYYGDKEFQWLDNYAGAIDAKLAAEILSRLLKREVAEEDITKPIQRDSLLDAVNELLENIDEDYYLRIIEINDVSPNDFE